MFKIIKKVFFRTCSHALTDYGSQSSQRPGEGHFHHRNAGPWRPHSVLKGH